MGVRNQHADSSAYEFRVHRAYMIYGGFVCVCVCVCVGGCVRIHIYVYIYSICMYIYIYIYVARVLCLMYTLAQCPRASVYISGKARVPRI